MNKSSYTLQLDNSSINEVKKYYQNYETKVDNQYILNHYKYNDVDISIYNSFKVLFVGKNASIEYNKFTHLINWEFKDSHAGSDEVGTGDFFGPIVVVSSFFKKEDLDFVNKLNIKDSKKLNDNYIREIGPKLIERFPHSILILHNEKYNEMINKGFNINKIKAYLHNKAYLNLQNKLNEKIPYFVLDEFCKKDLYFSYLNDYDNIEKNIIFKTKGEDKSPSVAISSLIARFVFLLEMDKLSIKAGFNLKKGENEEVINQYHLLIKKFGKDKLNQFAKLNFKTVNK